MANVSSQWGDYAVEKLLEMTGRSRHLRVITGVLTEPCLDLRRLEASRANTGRSGTN